MILILEHIKLELLVTRWFRTGTERRNPKINDDKLLPVIPSGDELLTILEALSNPYRLRIVVLLRERRIHVSQLAREIMISRPLLYMHLKRLESAGLVTSKMEISEDGKAMNYFELVPFELKLTPNLIAEAVKTLTIKKTGTTKSEKSEKEND